MTRAEMLARMSGKELTEWQAYDTVEPIGELRADIRAALICATVVNAVRAVAGAKGSEAKVTDFMPFLPKEAPDPEALAHQIKALFAGIAKPRPEGADGDASEAERPAQPGRPGL